MNDNNTNNELEVTNQAEDKKSACLLLRELAVDFEEQLYTIKLQLKSQISLLNEKEQELSEMERIKNHNIDLFSPIYNKTNNEAELVSTIEDIRKKINTYNEDIREFSTKIGGLKTAAQCMEELIKDADENENTKVNESQHKLTDKGLGILEAQEVERQRIARDLHDSTVQNLTSLVHKSELCMKLIDIDSIRAKLELNAMSNTLKMVINDMRGFIYNLKPMTLDDLGLTITVERFANRLMNLNNIIIKVNSNEEVNEILPVVKLTLFRIIQEACNNVIKHANATIINIDVKYDDKDITVVIKDNGTGFNINNLKSSEQSSSFGLSIMKERISLLSGTLNIQSENGKGTIITVSIPITICEGDKDEQTY